METGLTTFEDFEFLQFDQDSYQDSLWEFIDISDSDSEPPHRSDGPTIESSDGPTVLSIDSPTVSPVPDPTRARRRQTRLVRLLDLPFQSPLDRRGVEDDDVSGVDEEEDDNEYGLDDELVPWSVSDKVGRERMRKLGKRTFTKMLSSKRSPYLVVRPGCVRGKHGLGLKHIY